MDEIILYCKRKLRETNGYISPWNAWVSVYHNGLLHLYEKLPDKRLKKAKVISGIIDSQLSSMGFLKNSSHGKGWVQHYLKRIIKLKNK